MKIHKRFNEKTILRWAKSQAHFCRSQKRFSLQFFYFFFGRTCCFRSSREWKMAKTRPSIREKSFSSRSAVSVRLMPNGMREKKSVEDKHRAENANENKEELRNRKETTVDGTSRIANKKISSINFNDIRRVFLFFALLCMPFRYLRRHQFGERVPTRILSSQSYE